MKPFVAITVLVAASLTAVSAAPGQQQIALGSRSGSQGLRPSGGFSSSVNLQPGLAGQASHPGGFFPSGASFGGQVSGGLVGYPSGYWQGQGPSAANFWPGSYQGSYYYPYQSYFPGYYGQSSYVPGYGNGVYWGQTPGYAGSGHWGLPGYGSVSPAGFLSGGLGSQNVGNFQGQWGTGQVAVHPGRLSSGSGSSGSLQSAVRRQ